MAKKKLKRFAENATFANMFQRSFEELDEKGFELKGKWRENFFGNNNPIILEIACGKGEYAVQMAENIPGKNFIGIDIKGSRMWKGCKYSNQKGLTNVAFIRSQIELIRYFFGEKEIDEIWITFPDPFLKRSKRKKRLTSPQFLQRYKPLLKDDSIIHLKTDDDTLFAFTKEVIETYKHKVHQISTDIYQDQLKGPITDIQTFYEQMWLEKGKPIKYICFSLNKTQMDDQ
ncbi:MAG: tRNA (guanosine(46)-N7)-methyltransferase TrmB [Bacteroidales bacterium]